MSDYKLRIPGPDEHDSAGEQVHLDFSISLGLILGFVLAAAIASYTHQQAISQGKVEVTSTQEGQIDPGDTSTTNLKAVHRKLTAAHEQNWQAPEWRGREAVALLRYGPSAAAEAACEDAFAPAGSLSREIRIELLASINREAAHTPWACLLRAHFDGWPGKDTQLSKAVDQFWARMSRFEAPSAAMTTIAEEYGDADLFDQPVFRDWLYRCAFRVTMASRACRQALQTRSNTKTFLELFDDMIEHFKGHEDLGNILAKSMDSLTWLAIHGSLEGWQPPEALNPSSVRLGAVFWMCRLVNSPQREVAWSAARGLADTVEMIVRAGDEAFIPRWQLSCRTAFGAQDAEGAWRAPALAVWNGEEDKSIDYNLQHAQSRGVCDPVTPDAPLWTCALDAWRGDGDEEMHLELLEFFAKTAWIEWED